MSIELPMVVVWGMFGYLLVTTFAAIWWAATQTADMKVLKELVNKLINSDGLYARKEDVVRELGVIEKTQETMWERLDKLKEKVDNNIK